MYLLAKFHTAVRADHATGSPDSIRSAQHTHGTSNFASKGRSPPTHFLLNQANLLLIQSAHGVRIALDQLAHGSIILESLNISPEILTRFEVHITNDRTRVHSVDSGAVCQLARPGASHRLQCSLGSTVDRLAHEAKRGRDTRGIDDAAAAVGGEVWGDCLGEEKRGEDVDRVLPVKVLRGDGPARGIVQVAVSGDAGIVDQDVNLQLARGAKFLLCRVDDSCHGLFGLAQVGLDRFAADAVGGGQRGTQVFCVRARGLGCEVQEQGAALGGKVASNGFADS